MTNPPVLIVGTGRCGSTMISDIIRQHPDILSLSELFITTTRFCKNIAGALPSHPITGPEFWTIQTAIIPEVTTLLRNGICFSEMIYPVHRSGMMFGIETGVPAIMQATLPHLSDQPDALYRKLENFVTNRPEATARAHYDAMFGWLMRLFGKKTWVERSGGSTYILEHLLDLYPEAKFIHVVRDGVATARSMSKHSGYRLLLGTEKVKHHLGVDPYVSADRSQLNALPAALLGLLPERFDQHAFDALDIPVELFGASWSEHVASGFESLNALAPGRVLNLHYGTLCADPVSQIARLIAFIGVNCEAHWLATVAGSVRSKSGTHGPLAPEEARRLEEACAPGMALLHAHASAGTFE